jgi:copper chaperone
MNNVHYNVNGLLNVTMKTQVKSVLENLDGVQHVNVDLVRGSVEVDFNEKTEESEIRKSIEKIGCKIE